MYVVILQIFEMNKEYNLLNKILVYFKRNKSKNNNFIGTYIPINIAKA